MAWPAIDPVALSLGPVAVHWYAILVAAGAAAALALARLAAGQRTHPRVRPPWPGPAPLTPGACIDHGLWMTLGALAGGRLGYMLAYAPQALADDPLTTLRLWEGGMSGHGALTGMALAALALWAWDRFRNPGYGTHTPARARGDLYALALPAVALGTRLGNAANGELWGRPTDAPWGIVLESVDALGRHPSPLYGAALEGLLPLAVAWGLSLRTDALRTPGLVASATLTAHSAGRALGEFFRAPDAHLAHLAETTGWTLGGWLTLPVLLGSALAGGWLLHTHVRARTETRNVPPRPSA